MLADRTRLCLLAALVAISAFGGVTRAQQTKYPKPAELPNPYRLVAGWPTLPQNMNGGPWGEAIRVHLHAKGNVLGFHQGFNVVPPGLAGCLGRRPAEPPVFEFDPFSELPMSCSG